MKFLICISVLIPMLGCATSRSVEELALKDDRLSIKYELNGVISYKKYKNMSEAEARNLYEAYRIYENSQTRYKNGWEQSFIDGNYVSASKVCHDNECKYEIFLFISCGSHFLHTFKVDSNGYFHHEQMVDAGDEFCLKGTRRPKRIHRNGRFY